MSDMTAVAKTIRAALEREPGVDIENYPLRVEFDVAHDAIVLEGEVASIIAKKRAFAVASHAAGAAGVMDRLTVAPAERRGDGAVRSHLSEALLREPTLRECGIDVRNKGASEALRVPVSAEYQLHVQVEEGVIRLTGGVPSLSHRRLAGVLAWWTPGCRDVLNGLKVVPPESDNDDEIADAVRLVLEMDPLLPRADEIAIRVRGRVVTLEGIAPSPEQRHMAELDAWYVLGVEKVVNHILVRSAGPAA
jgi:osmotically-inducible protein OsmY